MKEKRPACELDMLFPCCNDSRLEDKGYPLISFVHIFSIDTHHPSNNNMPMHNYIHIYAPLWLASNNYNNILNLKIK